MNIFPETDVDSLDPKNRDQITNMARELLRGGNPGIFSTVDQSGFPQSRWMATMSFDDFPDLCSSRDLKTSNGRSGVPASFSEIL